MFFVTSVVLPFVFMLLMNLIEGLIESLGWERRLMKVAWDACVLALGITGGIFANPDVVRKYTANWAVVLGLASVVVSLGLAMLIAYLRRNPVAGWKPLVALLLGGLALGPPTYLTLAT